MTGQDLLFFYLLAVCPEWDFIRGEGNMFTVTLLLTECTTCFLHQIVSCPFKVRTETPSVPVRPGTSSLPTWPPRRLCHWRRTAAVGVVSPPPPAAPLETPPAASAGPAAPAGSLQTARREFREKNKKRRHLGKVIPAHTQTHMNMASSASSFLIWMSLVFICACVLCISSKHFRMYLLCKCFINQFDLNVSILSHLHLSPCHPFSKIPVLSNLSSLDYSY